MLDELGWDRDWARLASTYGGGSAPARVARAAAGRLLLATASGERRAAAPAGTAPVAGDWVLTDGEAVTALLPRRTELVRGAGRRAAAAQVLAANVDVVLVVVALATPPNQGRLARMLAVAWDSGAQPVVVLTKADLTGTGGTERDEVAQIALTAPVVTTSTVDGRGLAELRGHLRPGRTAALLGVSGAGKSSLLNALAGAELAAVAELGATGKGRHTTTPIPPPRDEVRRRGARRLWVLPGLGVLIDTPGLRGVQPWQSEEGLDKAFADIVALAGQCRFADCRHDGEPGCAVAAAVEAGELSARRVAAHTRLEREVAWLRDRYGARLRAEQRRQWRENARASRSDPRRAAARRDLPPR
ncbi:MAG TPA: ribosome small subunit-dependent GTPase A [Mycobacteriales bacterium]